MLKAKQACEAAGISYPAEVLAYFGNWINYKEETLRREMVKIDIDDAVEAGSHDSTNSWTVTLAKLPKACIAVVFENSY